VWRLGNGAMDDDALIVVYDAGGRVQRVRFAAG
jgi:hypothetical protein